MKKAKTKNNYNSIEMAQINCKKFGLLFKLFIEYLNLIIIDNEKTDKAK